MHFLRDDHPTMRALDDFIVTRHAAGGLARPDGLPDDATLGGIRVLSLRLPLPEAGAAIERTSRKPLSEYPKTVRKHFYHTPDSTRVERCGYREPPRPKPTDPEPDDAPGPGPRTPETEPPG
jgi:hypothetical protein